MKQLKSSLTVRGDSLYCPLAFSLDSYGNCLTDCHHCWIRHLNHTWGQELKPVDLELLEKRLSGAAQIKDPKAPVSICLRNKNTIRWGNKTDPFQEAEKTHRLAPKILDLLLKYNWSFVIQTRFTHIMMEYETKLMRAHRKGLLTVMPVMSPGLDKDWEILERSRTTPPLMRLKHARYLLKKGVNVGINGEPFIPGFHTVKDFEETMKLLKKYGIPSYNTYNLHMNAYVTKRLHAIGLDIEKIWTMNQDREWKKILRQLMDLSQQYGIRLGVPDFVNTGWSWVEKANTCCGVEVPNPMRFNTHVFKRMKQAGMSPEKILELTDDRTADFTQARDIVEGKKCEFYTLGDIIK